MPRGVRPLQRWIKKEDLVKPTITPVFGTLDDARKLTQYAKLAMAFVEFLNLS